MATKRSKKPVINYPPCPTRKWIPPDKRPKSKPPPAYQKPAGISQKLKVSSLGKIWHQFRIVGNNAILVGHFSQTHKKYTFKTNGYQGACNCVMACVFGSLYKMSNWDRNYLDRILDLGDDLYVRSITQPENTCLVEVSPQKVFNSFYLDSKKINVLVDDDSKVIEKTTTTSEQKVKEAFSTALKKFFKLFPSGILTMLGKSVAIWIQDNAYYFFDPTEHDWLGEKWGDIPSWGYSFLCRCKTIKDLVDVLYKNVDSQKPHQPFEIVCCIVQRIVNIQADPPERFEDIATVAETPITPQEIEDVQEEKLRDVMEEKLTRHVEAFNAVNPDDEKIEEISPEIGDTFPNERKPSWHDKDSFNKMDFCRFPVPYKKQPDKVSYYLEIEDNKIGILRGTTCQTDPKFSKYLGRQSMGNAISALIMLKFHKSKVWVPLIVNTILKYGDLLYRDAMISIPRTQSLKLSNFQKKTEYEGKNFLPVVEDYVVVGRLQSQDYDVLDLFPALEAFLVDNECCVIIGPLTLAVWIEDDRFYMYDPNERDKNGKATTKTAVFSNNLIPLDYVPGVACVVYFQNLKDLVDLYMANVEKPRKMDPFYLSKVHITDYIEVPEPWYNFKGLISGKWILRGTISQSNKKYSKMSRNFQSPANSLIALALQALKPIKDWDSDTVNEVLDAGDELYNATVENLTAKNVFENRRLMLSEINTIFKMYDKEANFEITECLYNGIVNAKNQSGLPDLTKALEELFRDNDMCIVTTHNISVGVWKKDEIFYCFDGHNRDDKGLATGYGTACVLRTLYINELATALEANLSPDKEDLFNIARIKLIFYDASAGDVVRPPLNNYSKINDDCAILRSLFSEISTKYDIRCGKQTIPMCLTALTFNKLKPSLEWNKHDMDEILNKGDNLFVETMSEIQRREEEEIDAKAMELDEEGNEGEDIVGGGDQGIMKEGEEEEEGSPRASGDSQQEVEEDKVTLDNVKNEYALGLNKFKLEFEEVDSGIISQKLRVALKEFYEGEKADEDSNQELILESKSLSVAIWRDDKVFYVFDSKPRDKQGEVIGKEDWSEADDINESISQAATFEGYDTEGDEKDKLEEIQSDVVQNITELDEFGGSAAGDHFMVGKKAMHQEEEEGHEMFEAKSADEEGIKYIKPLRKSSSFWREKEKQGKACTMWFTKLDDLVDHVCGSIAPKNAKNGEFFLKAVNIINIVQIKDKLRPLDERIDVYHGNWYAFSEIEHGMWILRGTMNILSELFPEKNRGKQSIAVCCAALIIAYVYHTMCYAETAVDSILCYGDKLFTFMKKIRKKQLMMNIENKLNKDEVEWLIEHEEFEVTDIPKKICIYRFMTEFEVEPDVIVGDIKAQNFEDMLDVKRGMENFFKSNKYGLLQSKDLIVGIWKGVQTYYMFDGLNRGPNGVVSPNGTACITRFRDTNKMAKVFLANLPQEGKNSFYIHRVDMKMDLCPRYREPKRLEEPKLAVTAGSFRTVMPGKAVVRGNISQEDPKFGKGPNVLSAPIAIIALTMSLIHKATTWSRPIIDDIIELGAELYEESVANLGFDFNPWEEKLDIERVQNDYSIGILKANCEIRLTDQKGIIDTKAADTLNLRQGIEKFFEENTHGIVVTEIMTVAIWEEEKDTGELMIYMLDPNPRGPLGMPVFSGTACLVRFVNAQILADHIIGCILDPEKRLGEFTIAPVEIVVGDISTKKKLERTPTKSSIAVVPRCSKLVANEEKKFLRRIAENERKRKEAKRLQQLGRKGYYTMRAGEAIIRGYRSQSSENYSEASRDNQDIPNCIVALVMHHLFSVENWSSKHIDLILDTGDQLYIDSYIAYCPTKKKLGLQNIVRKFLLKNLEIHVTIYKPIVSDVFTATILNRTLNVFFQQEQFCMLDYENQWVSIIFKSGLFYLFDPHERNIEGNSLKEQETDGTAVVLRFENLYNLALKVIDNFVINVEEDVGEFTLWLLSVEIKQ